jgi:phosphatidylserine/phosphatidylglycerophosphate/cardiolipin synthase-like enzyme
MKRKIKSTLLVAVVTMSIFLSACGYVNRTSVAQTISNFSSAVKSGTQQEASGNQYQNSVPYNTGTVQYYFPRGGEAPEPVLVGLMNSAKSSLDVAIYSITDSRISDAIIAAKKRDVTVRVISDKSESKSSYQKKLMDEIKSAGIPVKINAHDGIMHLKVSIIDKSIVTTGSFNYSKAAESENDEVFVVLDDVKATQDFDAEFNQMWGDSSKFKDY